MYTFTVSEKVLRTILADKSDAVITYNSVPADCIYKVISQKGGTNFTLETLDATTRTEDCTQKFLANAAAARHFLKCIFSHPETGVQREKRTERGSRQLDRRRRDIPLQETGSARSPCNSGLFKVTSSIVITMSLEVNSTCRKDYHSQFHWNTVMWPGLLAQHWTCCKKIEKMNIGMWSRIEVYQILWQDSQRSHCWKGNLPKDICGPGRDWRKFHRCCTSLRITKPWLKWSEKGEVLRWDMFPEPTELRLMGCSTESIWTPRSKSNMLTPKTQLADMLTEESITRDEWDHLLRLINIVNLSMFSCSHFLSWKRGPQWRSRDQWILVSNNLTSAKKDPPQDLSDPNSLGNQELDQSCVSVRGRKLLRNTNQNPTICSQERQQGQSSSTRKLGAERWIFKLSPRQETERSRGGQPIRKVEVAQCADLRLSVPWESLQESAEKVESRWKRTTNYRSVEDQRTDLGTVYDDNNESRHSPCSKLHWEFGSFQEHELEELQNLFHITQKLVLHHQREILNVKTIERTSLSWTRSTLSHDLRPFRSKSKMGGSSKRIQQYDSYGELFGADGEPIEFEWNIFPGFTSLEILQRIHDDLQDQNIEPEKLGTNHLHVDVQWCLMDKERKLRTTFFKFRTCRKDTGHSWTCRWKEMVWNSKFVHLKADGIPL